MAKYRVKNPYPSKTSRKSVIVDADNPMAAAREGLRRFGYWGAGVDNEALYYGKPVEIPAHPRRGTRGVRAHPRRNRRSEQMKMVGGMWVPIRGNRLGSL